MSAPHIILDNLPSFAKNCQIWWKFDVIITKIILLVFFETRYMKGGNAAAAPPPFRPGEPTLCVCTCVLCCLRFLIFPL